MHYMPPGSGQLKVPPPAHAVVTGERDILQSFRPHRKVTPAQRLPVSHLSAQLGLGILRHFCGLLLLSSFRLSGSFSTITVTNRDQSSDRRAYRDGCAGRGWDDPRYVPLFKFAKFCPHFQHSFRKMRDWDSFSPNDATRSQLKPPFHNVSERLQEIIDLSMPDLVADLGSFRSQVLGLCLVWKVSKQDKSHQKRPPRWELTIVL